MNAVGKRNNLSKWRRRCGVLLVAVAGLAHGAPGGISAMPIPAADKAPLVNAVRAGSRIIALGDHGVVVLSVDGGRWRQANHVAVSSPLTALWFIDGKNGWGVGHGGVILRTSDGGGSWRLQHVVENEPALLSVWFENGLHGIVTGGYGAAYETHDGGQSWQRLKVADGANADRHLNAIIPLRPDTLFIAGEGGAAYRSTDSGRTWTALQTGTSGSLWNGLALRDGSILLFGMSGRVIISRDKGETWQSVDSGTHNALTSGVQLNDGRVVLAGNGGAVGVAAEPVRRFETTVRPDRQNIAAVAAAEGNAVLLFNQQGVSQHVLPK